MGKLRRWWLAGLVSVIDVVIVAGSVWFAVGLKWDDWALLSMMPLTLAVMATMVPVSVVIFWGLGLYRGSWRLASVDDFVRSSQAAAVTVLAGGGLLWLLPVDAPAISFFLLHGLVLMLLINSLRGAVRMVHGWRDRRMHRGMPVLIYGAGRNGVMALREMLTNQEAGLLPVGFIDDDPEKIGRQIQGFRVYGPIEHMMLPIRGARGVVIASSLIPPQKVRVLSSLCSESRMQIRKFDVELREFAEGKRPEPVRGEPIWTARELPS